VDIISNLPGCKGELIAIPIARGVGPSDFQCRLDDREQASGLLIDGTRTGHGGVTRMRQFPLMCETTISSTSSTTFGSAF
jgi:hypothetical protein